MATMDDFKKLDMRVGKILNVEDLPNARKPFYKVDVYFGPETGNKLSIVQAKREYTKEQLIGREIIGVVNFEEKKNIAGVDSEVLLLGVHAEDGGLSLLVHHNIDFLT